jgi:AraC-like DNA-binding protein/quercetin dioxygenase-like cupin family protein
MRLASGERKVIALSDAVPRVAMANFIKVEDGSEWGPRTIPDWELVLVVRGALSYTSTSGSGAVVARGDILCIPPEEEHLLVCCSGSSDRVNIISCIHLELEVGSWAAGDYAMTSLPPLITKTLGDPLFPHLFKRCSETFEGYGPLRERLVDAMVRELWLRLVTLWMGESPRPPTPRVRRMQEFLRERLDRPVTRRDLAQAFGLSPERVNTVFKREVGVSPGTFVRRERVLLAYELLAYEGLSVKETAYRTGFSDAFHFSKVFKSLLGIPPSHLSRRYGQPPGVRRES